MIEEKKIELHDYEIKEIKKKIEEIEKTLETTEDLLLHIIKIRKILVSCEKTLRDIIEKVK